MSATRTWAVIDGTILAVDSSSSCVIWSLFDVPFLPRMDMISSIFFLTFSSLSTICSCTFLGWSSLTSFSFFSLAGRLFLFTFSKPSSSLSSSSLPVFIHLLMPVRPEVGPASELDEDESEPQSLSSSSSSSSSSESFLGLEALGFSFSFSFSSSSLSSSELDSSSSDDSLSSSASSSASSSSGFSWNLAICSSYWALFFLMFWRIALKDFELVLENFLIFSLSLNVSSHSSASCSMILM
mmetsp:Transcript_28659/g.70967  ORF Transcript_28659/g.70967 Transcript_28659/m.70967 type:complete len:240 (-) Transcript_28659:461-1180(-)